MEGKIDLNNKSCNCSYESCARKRKCCDCIADDLESDELLVCCFPDDVERSNDRSVARFFSLYRNRL